MGGVMEKKRADDGVARDRMARRVYDAMECRGNDIAGGAIVWAAHVAMIAASSSLCLPVLREWRRDEGCVLLIARRSARHAT
ncbi:hypothetical protein [Acetobacter sacchari]|uniref:hypothetical protein n=1 Tax=Acetobacter sacchari TaxID=2661687 RepID=UPI001A9F018C|nr:hypothetical protein [Acetobacter sacchari]